MSDSSGFFNGIPIEESAYNYLPSRHVAIIFLILFGVSTLVHVAQSFRYRLWYLIPTAVLCGFIELIGWAGRLWSSFNPFLDPPFQMQITCTIIAPTPLLAANFVIFGQIIERLGHQYSRLTPKWYTIIFCTCDVISLVVQGVGGGLAASADNLVDANKGGNVMLGGIVFQLIVIIGFSICVAEYIVRYINDAPVKQVIGEKGIQGRRGMFTRKLTLMTAGLSFITLVLFIRSIYRTIELSDGWNGRIISTQVYFNVLDGAMVILAIYSLNIAHPGLLLAAPRHSELAKEVSA